MNDFEFRVFTLSKPETTNVIYDPERDEVVLVCLMHCGLSYWTSGFPSWARSHSAPPPSASNPKEH